MGFAVTDAATGLKLIEAGVPKETLAMLAVPMIPFQITLPWIVSRYASGTDGVIFFKAGLLEVLSLGKNLSG